MTKNLKYNPGDKIGPYNIELLERLLDDNRKSLFRCSFCGNKFESYFPNIVTGTTKSCGCQRYRYKKDIRNLRFGKLVTVCPTSKRKNHSVVWKCKCDCGKVCYISERNLVSGCTLSCGCLDASKGEIKIKQILSNLDLEFIYNRPVLNGNNFRPDFYIHTMKIVIEYDGEQHFRYRNTGWNTEEHYKQTVKRDKKKNQYYIEHSLACIRIPY